MARLTKVVSYLMHKVVIVRWDVTEGVKALFNSEIR